MHENLPNTNRQAQQLVTDEYGLGWKTIALPHIILERLEARHDELKGPELADALHSLPKNDEQWQGYTYYKYEEGEDQLIERSPQEEAALTLIDAVAISSKETISAFCKRADLIKKSQESEALFPLLDYVVSTMRLININNPSQEDRQIYPLLELLYKNAPPPLHDEIARLARGLEPSQILPEPKPEPKKESLSEADARLSYPRVAKIAKRIDEIAWDANEDSYDQIQLLIGSLPQRTPLEHTLRLRLATGLLEHSPEHPKAPEAQAMLDKYMDFLKFRPKEAEEMPSYLKSAMADEIKRRLHNVSRNFQLSNMDAQNNQELTENLDVAEDETLFLGYLFNNLKYSRQREHQILLQGHEYLANADTNITSDIYDYISDYEGVNSVVKVSAALATLEKGAIGQHVFDNARAEFTEQTRSAIKKRHKAAELGFESHKLPDKVFSCSTSYGDEGEPQLTLLMLPSTDETQPAINKLTNWMDFKYGKWWSQSSGNFAINLNEIIRFTAIAVDMPLKPADFKIAQTAETTTITAGHLSIEIPGQIHLAEDGTARAPFVVQGTINSKDIRSLFADDSPGFFSFHGNDVTITVDNPSKAEQLLERFQEISGTLSPNTDLTKNRWSTKIGVKTMSAEELRYYREIIRRKS